MSDVETIKQVYEAFGRGDIPGILQRLAEDVRWEQWPTGNAAQERDVPYMRPRSGRQAVGGFFQDVQEDFQLNSFSPHSFLGKVAAHRHFLDTAKAIDAHSRRTRLRGFVIRQDDFADRDKTLTPPGLSE